jgi:hypothetical protein
MTTSEEQAAERRARDTRREQEAQRQLRREARVRRAKDIIWSAVIATVIMLIVFTSLGWLTTQAVVEKAREEGAKELVALRASICTVRFQQRPDAAAKIAELKALSYSDKNTAIKKLVTEEKLATMQGEDAAAPGAIDKIGKTRGRVIVAALKARNGAMILASPLAAATPPPSPPNRCGTRVAALAGRGNSQCAGVLCLSRTLVATRLKMNADVQSANLCPISCESALSCGLA